MTPSLADLLSFKDFTAALHCSARTGRRIIASGALGFVKVGGAMLIPKAELEKFLSERFIPARTVRREQSQQDVMALLDSITARRRGAR